jgi:hypothetical protein
MVWLDRNRNAPEFELIRLEKSMQGVRAHNRVQRPAESRVGADRWLRRRFGGRLSEWPRWRKARKVP